MKIIKTTVISIMVFFIQLFGMTNYAMATEYYLIPYGNYFEVYSWDDHDLKLSQKITFENIYNPDWSNYNIATGDVYFEAKDINATYTTYVYKFNIKTPYNLKPVLEGRYPTLSTDGKYLVYYQHPNQLWLFNLKSEQTEMIADDIDNFQPPVWISPSHLLYYSKTRKIILLDILTKEKRATGHEKIVPGALSPDGKIVLCTDGHKIFLYSIDTNKIEVIKESKYLSIGSTFIWRPDGKSFFYARRTWAKQFQFLESRDLFLFSMEEKTEKRIAGMTFWGGVFIGNSFNPRWK